MAVHLFILSLFGYAKVLSFAIDTVNSLDITYITDFVFYPHQNYTTHFLTDTNYNVWYVLGSYGATWNQESQNKKVFLIMHFCICGGKNQAENIIYMFMQTFVS